MEYLSSSISAIQAVHLKLSLKLSFFSCKGVVTIIDSVHTDFRISDLMARNEFDYETELKKINYLFIGRQNGNFLRMSEHCKVA